MHYNFARIHQSLRITPAMAVGITDPVWSLEEIVRLRIKFQTVPLPAFAVTRP
jgi:hypothetical protein